MVVCFHLAMFCVICKFSLIGHYFDYLLSIVVPSLPLQLFVSSLHIEATCTVFYIQSVYVHVHVNAHMRVWGHSSVTKCFSLEIGHPHLS